MSESQKIYSIGEGTRKEIEIFLKNPFDGYEDVLNLVSSKDSYNEEEINQIVFLLGKFPAFLVYPIIDQFRGDLKLKEIGEH